LANIYLHYVLDIRAR